MERKIEKVPTTEAQRAAMRAKMKALTIMGTAFADDLDHKIAVQDALGGIQSLQEMFPADFARRMDIGKAAGTGDGTAATCRHHLDCSTFARGAGCLCGYGTAVAVRPRKAARP